MAHNPKVKLSNPATAAAWHRKNIVDEVFFKTIRDDEEKSFVAARPAAEVL
jgi:hypothetical protein